MLVLFCLDPLLHAILSLLRFANYSDLRLFASFLTVSSLATFACFSCHISLVALRFVLARAACAVRAAHIMPQDNTVRTQIVGGITYNWVSVPNQRATSGFSWTSPSVVSAAGFSTVVPPLSGFPQDVGWPIWGAGLRIVYSHDGPFGIYGTRIFVLFRQTQIKTGRLWSRTTIHPSRLFLRAFCPLLDGGQIPCRKYPSMIMEIGGCCACLELIAAVLTLDTIENQIWAMKHSGPWQQSALLSIMFLGPSGVSSRECKATRTLGDFAAMA